MFTTPLSCIFSNKNCEIWSFGHNCGWKLSGSPPQKKHKHLIPPPHCFSLPQFWWNFDTLSLSRHYLDPHVENNCSMMYWAFISYYPYIWRNMRQNMKICCFVIGSHTWYDTATQPPLPPPIPQKQAIFKSIYWVIMKGKPFDVFERTLHRFQ